MFAYTDHLWVLVHNVSEPERNEDERLVVTIKKSKKIKVWGLAMSCQRIDEMEVMTGLTPAQVKLTKINVAMLKTLYV